MKIAAIDIGSNAARLLIVEAIEDPKSPTVFNKVDLIRVPLRLGFDVFKSGAISKSKADMVINTMQAFKYLMNAYKVEAVKACATSAMRDAQNSRALISKVKEITDIPIQIISGDEEAGLVFENHIAETLDKNKAYLYIDVGGGSTELNFYLEAKQIYKKSFQIGTIRILNNQVSSDDWNELRNEIKKNIKSKLPIYAIGSGGNINKIFSLSKTKDGKPLSFRLLKNFHHEVASMNVEQRIQKWNLKEDRADVIEPAFQIFTQVMRWASASEIYVPKIGVSDGLVRDLYREIKNGDVYTKWKLN